MSGVRGFATKAKNFITYSFTHNGFKIVWRNRIHHSGEGDWAIKQALAKYSDTIQEKEYHEVQFRGSDHDNPPDPKRHWTMYWLVKKKIVQKCHLYQNGTMSDLWDVDEEEAIRKALPDEEETAEDMNPVEVKADPKAGEAGGEGSKAAGGVGNGAA